MNFPAFELQRSEFYTMRTVTFKDIYDSTNKFWKHFFVWNKDLILSQYHFHSKHFGNRYFNGSLWTSQVITAIKNLIWETEWFKIDLWTFFFFNSLLEKRKALFVIWSDSIEFHVLLLIIWWFEGNAFMSDEFFWLDDYQNLELWKENIIRSWFYLKSLRQDGSLFALQSYI